VRETEKYRGRSALARKLSNLWLCRMLVDFWPRERMASTSASAMRSSDSFSTSAANARSNNSASDNVVTEQANEIPESTVANEDVLAATVGREQLDMLEAPETLETLETFETLETLSSLLLHSIAMANDCA